MLGPKHRVPEAVCPACHRPQDGASSASGGREAPKPGDLAICIDCAGVAQYDAAMQLKPFDVSTLPADEAKQIEHYRTLIRRTKLRK